MPKPQNKDELLQAIEEERRKLNQSFEALTDDEMTQPGACEAWSVKDILAHLVDWERRGLRWYRAGLRGEVPKLPDENYNWRQTPDLNHAIYLKYKDLPLEEILKIYKTTHQETMKALEGMSEEDLFNPNVYA